MAVFALALTLFLPLFSSSQAINTAPAEVLLPEPAFNKEFIRKNKIRIIRASIVDKPDGEIIRDKGLAENFLFDTTGTLVRHFYNEITSLQKTEIEMPAVYGKRGRVVKKSFTKINYEYQYDTLGTEYLYTSNGYLRMKRVCIGDFFHTTYYEYFGQGLVSRQVLCKETNSARPGEPFRLGVQIVLSEEKFEYEQLAPTQVKKKFLNDEGKPYKQGIINFRNNRPIDEFYEFSAGFIRSGITYTYNGAGLLTEKVTTDNSSGSNSDKISYEYDDQGNLIKEKKFKNGTQTDEIIFLYEAAPSPVGRAGVGLLLTTQIDRQLQKESIKIVKYEYEFYP